MSSGDSSGASTEGRQSADTIQPQQEQPVNTMDKPQQVSGTEATKATSAQLRLPNKHHCSKCKYSTRNKVLFDNHTCDNLDEDNNLEEQTLITLTFDKVKKYHCSECDVWAQGHAFEEHLMCHIILRPYQCLYCSQCFVNRREIGRHVVKEHVGKKMNCALRALKRAKGLMKATLESGMYQFYAGVAGRVPLSNDPDKSKNKQKKSKTEAPEESPKEPSSSSTSSSSAASSKDVNTSNEVTHSSASSSDTQHSSSEMTMSATSSNAPKPKILGDDLSSNKESQDKVILGSEDVHPNSSLSVCSSSLDEAVKERTSESKISSPHAGVESSAGVNARFKGCTHQDREDSREFSTSSKTSNSGLFEADSKSNSTESTVVSCKSNGGKAATENGTKTSGMGDPSVETSEDGGGIIARLDEKGDTTTTEAEHGAYTVGMDSGSELGKSKESGNNVNGSNEIKDAAMEANGVKDVGFAADAATVGFAETIEATKTVDDIQDTMDSFDKLEKLMESIEPNSASDSNKTVEERSATQMQCGSEGSDSIIPIDGINSEASETIVTGADMDEKIQPDFGTDKTLSSACEVDTAVPDTSKIKDRMELPLDTLSTDKVYKDKDSVEESAESAELTGSRTEVMDSGPSVSPPVVQPSCGADKEGLTQAAECEETMKTGEEINNQSQMSDIVGDGNKQSQREEHDQVSQSASDEDQMNQSASDKDQMNQSESNKDQVNQSECNKDQINQSADNKDQVNQSADTRDEVNQSAGTKEQVNQSAVTKDQVIQSAGTRDELNQSAGTKDQVNHSAGTKDQLNQSVDKITDVNQENGKKIENSDREIEEAMDVDSGMSDTRTGDTSTEVDKEREAGREVVSGPAEVDKPKQGAGDSEFPESNFDQSEEEESEMGLKIVAAFSLQGDGDGAEEENRKVPGSGHVKKATAKVNDSALDSSREKATQGANMTATSGGSSTPVPRTLGPPSTPVPSSSFLGVSPAAETITSRGVMPKEVPTKNCFFFVCGFSCSFSCLTSPEFRDHLILDHAGESQFSCFHCGYQSSSEDGLVRHISAHAHTYSKSVPLYICGASACKFGSNLVADFITHQSSWHPDLTTFHCHDCDERYDSVAQLLKHFEENFLHIINCPHCTAKTTERRPLLNHIASAHPGKPKMVSVAKQIVCRDRKLNNYASLMQRRNLASTTVAALSCQDGASNGRNKSLVSILTEPLQAQERQLAKQSADFGRKENVVKPEYIDEDDAFFDENCDDSFDEEEYGIHPQGAITYMGSKPDEREADNFKCQFCTFIARDRCRLEGHERCHGLPPSRKSRFKCMYCPQGFNNEHKFNSHVSCHPGLIKFSLFCCKHCDFDSNQRHIIVKHVRTTRDQVHISTSPNEEDMFVMLNKTMETRVLECSHCSYMTRHRKHLVAHLKREHSNPRRTGITVDCDIVEKYPSQSLGGNRNKALEMALSHDRAALLPVGDEGNVRENQARRFKCPICQYLVPRAADLKAHVKRHSEIGEITLVMFRCKYCSAASTAREIIYGHLMEKHLGKQIALVKRIVTIDTRGNDNGYAVTSMEDEEEQGERQSHPATDAGNKMGLLIPDSEGETFHTAMPCPCCPFSSNNRNTIIQHVANHHPDVSIMGQRPDNQLYPLDTPYAGSTSTAVTSSSARVTLGEALKGEILIVPDSQTFDEPVLCPKCDYATIHRRNIVQHLEQNHPQVSVMGRNDYPTFDDKSRAAVQANATGKDGMVIIGSGSLDEKIRCLYENYGNRMKCMICQAERPKKFFIHVHILRHLNILLWGCQFCSHKGLQKYKMMDHIKKVHPGRAFCIRYLPVNVEERVNQYLQNASMIRARRSGEEPDNGPGSKSPYSGSFQASSSSSTGDSDLNAMRMKYKASQDRLSGCTIGSEDLDMKLACLYSLGSDNRYHCVVCGQEFQRKFAIHRHIVQAHLRVNLIGCGYCEMEGVERHIMMDHIIETHKSMPINMRNLAQNLENKVADFLSKMTLCAEAAMELPGSELGLDNEFKLPEPPHFTTVLSPQRETSYSPTPSPHRTPSPRTSSPSTSSKNQLNPKLLLLGRDILHKHLQPMIKEVGNYLRCQVCHWDFPRKYAVHRHILMKHLKLGIIGCPYCPFEGVERYQVFTHIREDHKEAELSMKYLSVDLDRHVSEFMHNLANGTLDTNNRNPPPWSVKKSSKRDNLSDEEGETSVASPSSSGAGGLVVAMFGNKKPVNTSLIKEEPVDEEGGEDTYGQEPLDREVNGDDDESNISFDKYLSMTDDGDREVSSTSLLAANGTKAKVATDVQTNIRVITIKEKGFKRHICEKCKFTSLHRSNIVRHIYRVHEQYREHECPACNYKTLSRVLIEQHIINEHPGTPLPDTVPRAMKRKLEMSHQELEYDSMKKCKAAATSKRREADLPLLNSTNTQLYACAYCSFETMTHAEIVQHTRDKHSLGEPMKNQEEEEGGDEEGMGEADCTRMPQQREDAEFDSMVNTVSMNQVDISNGQEDALWQCFYCSYKTSDEEDLKIHFAESHPGNVYRSKKVPAWRFVCRSCHVKTRAHSKMRYHLNRHINYRPYTCTTCGSFYPSPDQCRKHCRANNHNETFTYVKIPRKERRLQELLKECQEIASALTRNSGDANSFMLSQTLSHTVPSKRKAKKSFGGTSRMIPAKLRKGYEYDATYSPRGSATQRSEEKPKEDISLMVCACCDFAAQNVCDVWLHFIKVHEEQEFRWLDSTTGYICTETGEITNAKDVTPDLEAPPGPGYTMMSSRLLSCEHCEFTTSTVQAMKSHLRRHLPKRYLCPYCSLRCSRRDTIHQHVRCGHRGRELWTIFFRLPEDYVADSETTSESAEPSVTVQSEGARQGGLEEGSISSTALLERIKCGQCEVKMESVAAIHNHHSEEHADLPFLWVDTINDYTCNFSGEVIDARERSPHLFSQDGFCVENDHCNTPTFCCKFCAFTSAFIQAIKSHMKSHLPHGFMCPYCCMNTNSKEKMMSHHSCSHRDQEPWILHLRLPPEPLGGAAATGAGASIGSSDQEKNIESSPAQSTGVTTYSCNECDYSSDDLYQYRIHLANHGNFPHLTKDVPDDQPFKCGYCSYVAQDEGDFGAHIASHLQRPNFRCAKCEFTAFKRSDVVDHIETSHEDDEDWEEVEVIDLQQQQQLAQSYEEHEGSSDELHLVNLEPKVKVTPVNDLDLDREGLTLFSPPSTPEVGEGGKMRMDSEDRDIVELEPPNSGELDLDNQSDSTEEWGAIAEDGSREASPDMSEQAVTEGDDAASADSPGGSILRLTLQGKLTGEYGIKRAVPVHKDPVMTHASANGDSPASLPSVSEGENGQDEEELEETQEFEPPMDDEVDSGMALMGEASLSMQQEEEEGVDEEMEGEDQGSNSVSGSPMVEEEEEEERDGEGEEDGGENSFTSLGEWMDT